MNIIGKIIEDTEQLCSPVTSSVFVRLPVAWIWISLDKRSR